MGGEDTRDRAREAARIETWSGENRPARNAGGRSPQASGEAQKTPPVGLPDKDKKTNRGYHRALYDPFRQAVPDQAYLQREDTRPGGRRRLRAQYRGAG